MTAPDPESAPETAPPGEASSDAAGAPRHRTHPITPLVTGWKIVVGIIAVLTAQNIARLLEDFTLQRALIGLAAVAAAVVIAIVLSALSWWFTTYAVDDHGVSLHRGMISKSREYAPRARIESVSVERPLLARLLGLAKVRVEVAGGGESYLDIEYVRSADAEELRRRVLGVAALASAPEAGHAADSEPRPAGAAPAGGTAAEQADVTGASAAPWSADGRTAADAAPATTSGAHLTAAAAPGADGAATGSGLESLLYDGVTDGELIAKIPTDRLVRSLLRDLGFVFGTLASVLGVGFAIVVGIWQEGINIAMIIALFPAFIAVPKFVFGRIESGWGSSPASPTADCGCGAAWPTPAPTTSPRDASSASRCGARCCGAPRTGPRSRSPSRGSMTTARTAPRTCCPSAHATSWAPRSGTSPPRWAPRTTSRPSNTC